MLLSDSNPNLVALAWIGMWALTPHVPEPDRGRSWLGIAYAWANPGVPSS